MCNETLLHRSSIFENNINNVFILFFFQISNPCDTMLHRITVSAYALSTKKQKKKKKKKNRLSSLTKIIYKQTFDYQNVREEIFW